MTIDRIHFAKNPWPKGHAIDELRWSGRIDPDRGLFFDLHLRTAEYSAGDRRRQDDDDEDGAWRAKGAWTNYHRCTLSSTKWRADDFAPDGDDAMGFLVATAKKPLDFATLARRPFRADIPPVDLDDNARRRAFDIYLLGHDSVADHRIHFARRLGPATYSLHWKGRIALTYAGDSKLRHRFEARARRLDFEGFAAPAGTKAGEARAMLEPFVTDIDAYVSKRRRGRVVLEPRSSNEG